jgi:hypothetical protein
MNRSQDEFADLPRALADRLAAEDRVTLVTPQVDEAVRRATAVHFAARGADATRDTRARSDSITRRTPRRWVFPAAAAAAAALFALIVVRPLYNVGTDAGLAANDVDGSGRVDILDAFALARARAADPARVTQGQIDALADQIVSLTSGANVR